ncbi:MAG: Hsp20/alpha crystallin family protein [Deltaproteobacteria bacterium]|nr:Hsp20/alpha crystallin family protein [Deltaproteobacteria bacterium]
MGRKKDETFDMLFSMKNKMDRFFAVSEPETSSSVARSGSQWLPAVDLFDLGDKYRVVIEVPGLDKEEIDLSVYSDKIVIKGRREEDYESPERGEVLCLERVCGRFERVILLPDPVLPERVKATLKNGILTIVLDKKILEIGKKSVTIE